MKGLLKQILLNSLSNLTLDNLIESQNSNLHRLLAEEDGFWKSKGLVLIFAIIVVVIVVTLAIVLTVCGGKKKTNTGKDPWNQDYNNNPVQQYNQNQNQDQQNQMYGTNQAVQGNNQNHFSNNQNQGYEMGNLQQDNGYENGNGYDRQQSGQNNNMESTQVWNQMDVVEYQMEDVVEYGDFEQQNQNQYNSMTKGGANYVSFIFLFRF